MLPQKLYRVRLILPILFVAFTSCSTKPVDPRSVMPADALVYLETKGLGQTIGAITESDKYQAAAKTKPDLYYLNDIELAIAVTGFETSQQAVTEESSILRLQPRFVAAAETRLWNFQAIKFTEEKLGSFINDLYGGEVLLETSDKHGGKYFVWTSEDGRKAYGLVIGSLIYFGNDQSALEKCLAVQRGEAESISKNSKVTDGERIGFGYISPDGIAQISNLAGIALAKQAGEDAQVQSFVARVLPELLRNSVREMTWTATKGVDGIVDRYDIGTTPETSTIFSETITPGQGKAEVILPFLHHEYESVTRYSLSDARIAWRSLLLTAQKATDTMSGNLILAFSESLFEPYGVDNSELFLSSVGPQIITARYDGESEKQVVIGEVKDLESLKRSVAAELAVNDPAKRISDADVWRSDDGDIALVLVDGKVILGDAESALKCLESYRKDSTQQKIQESLTGLSASNSVAVTTGFDTEIAGYIADVISERKHPKENIRTAYITETRINRRGIERITVSDFGLIGTIIAQFAPEG
jgi:hypothetical protein